MDKTIYSKEYSSIIDRLKKARKEAKLDQKSVAKRLKRTQSYISKMENGQCRLDILQLKEIAKAYKKNLGYFIK
ncbi:MAG: helix-turn-helix transcriptional regulator [Candidatus Omnitrophica bacterium]|nr:helix-turn-helix transcriptional regulator [Candidatus Omnitrophota bacterium]